MIKVIASDFDGTLLAPDHKPAPETVAAVKKAQAAGIRFIGVTGRNFHSALEALSGSGIECDYILASGAEIRDSKGAVQKRIGMDLSLCREIYDILKAYPISVTFMTDELDYMIGSPEEIEESFLVNMKIFFLNQTREEIKKSPMFLHLKEFTKCVPDFDAFAAANLPVYKMFLASNDESLLHEIEEKLSGDTRLAVASSFSCNLEITAKEAQKGPVLKEYIEGLGYTMDEVMVLGDSMNDYSMLSMDFGATVAMGNSVPKIKAAAKYITGSNTEHGAARAIEEMLKKQQNPGL